MQTHVLDLHVQNLLLPLMLYFFLQHKPTSPIHKRRHKNIFIHI